MFTLTQELLDKGHRFFSPTPQFQENRLAYFGIRAVESGPTPRDDGERRTEPKKNDDSPQAKQRREETLERKQKRVQDETQDRKQTDQKLTALEEKMGTATDKKESSEAIRERWLRGIEQELKLAEGSLKLGKQDEKVRRPVEQHGVYLNGKIIGNIFAGSENGKIVRDESKYDYSKSPDPDFLEKGFREQVVKAVKQAQAKEGQ